jgi:Cyclic nucleotide-binding domain
VFGAVAGIGSASLSTFVEHAVNLPLNAIRLREMRHLVASVREASAAELNIEWLKPFMHPRALKAGSRVFSKGDEASEAFLLVEGRIVISESSAALEPGTIFGEMALFTASGLRTASAVCTSDVRLLVITYEQFEQLYFQNQEFGLYLVRLIVRRFESCGGRQCFSGQLTAGVTRLFRLWAPYGDACLPARYSVLGKGDAQKPFLDAIEAAKHPIARDRARKGVGNGLIPVHIGARHADDLPGLGGFEQTLEFLDQGVIGLGGLYCKAAA